MWLLSALNVSSEGFPGGPVVKNLPCKAGDADSTLGLGRSHMLRATEPLSLRVATTEARMP